MKISEHYGSGFLKTEDFDREGQNLTISRCELETVGKEDEKPVLYFDQYDEGMPLNRTNAEIISEVLDSDDTDDWEGRDINVFQDKTMFNNKRVPCLRVRAVKEASKSKSKSSDSRSSSTKQASA